MIAIAFNNARGFSEFELRLPNGPERDMGMMYMAGKEYAYPGSVIECAAAYSPDGRTVLFFDSYFPTGQVDYRSSYVTVPYGQPWGGHVDETEGYEVRHAGSGPVHILFSRVDYIGSGLSFRRAWHIYHGHKQVTDTAGIFPTYVRSNNTIYFIPIGADDTLRRIDLDGANESVAHEFQGGHIRSLAVTRNRSVSRSDFEPGSDELLVSVYFPSQRKTTVFACYHSATGFHPHSRFEVAADWVSIAGTGIFGEGTRIAYNYGETILLWDNRDGNNYPIYTLVPFKNGYTYTAIGPFRQSALGSGLTISSDVPQ